MEAGSRYVEGTAVLYRCCWTQVGECLHWRTTLKEALAVVTSTVTLRVNESLTTGRRSDSCRSAAYFGAHRTSPGSGAHLNLLLESIPLLIRMRGRHQRRRA